MIKRHTFLLAILTAVFTAFTLGFFVGRNYNHTPVQISGLHYAEETQTSQSQLMLQAPSTESSVSTTNTQPVPSDTGIESTQPPTEAPAPQETSPANSGLININTASVAQLTTLPGIGEVLAQRIVDYREANGPFQSVAALTNVKGIGEKRLAAIIDLVTV